MDLPRVGDRIELIARQEDPDPVPAGMRGTVDDLSSPIHLPGEPPFVQIDVKWDDGRTRSLLTGKDEFRIVEA
jgi:hypothetical protein